MRSRRDNPSRTTGAHRAYAPEVPQPAPAGRAAHARHAAPTGRAAPAPANAVPRPPALAAGTATVARYEPYLDGLFTYCLSVMCEHDAAIDSLGEALVVADRQHDRQRAPLAQGLYRPWLYSLARWACLRRLTENGGGDSARPGGRTGHAAPDTALSEPVRTQRHRELCALAWPEAAGTSPEQREALELAVRHGLPAPEVAAVLSLSSDAALALLSHAACEVERTRAALAVVETGGCPAVSRLAGDDRLLLGTALRRELVRHVDECAACRRVAESAMSGVGWPGTAPAGSEELPVLVAPRPALAAAVIVVRRARVQRSPRFDRAGFPIELKDRAARRDRLRSRAVTTTVVATVLAAPVLALWAAYRGAPMTGEPDGPAVAAAEREDASRFNGHPYENAAQDGPHHRNGSPDTSRSPRVTVGPEGGKSERAGTPRSGAGDATAAGRLTVDARPAGDVTLITLTATGGAPVRWSASADAPWVELSRTGGVLTPGESYTLRAAVDDAREPARAWTAQIRIAPSGSVITLRGRGTSSPPAPENPTPPSQEPTPTPSDPPPTTEEPTPPPSTPPSSGEPSSSPSESGPERPSAPGEPSGASPS